MFSRARRKAVLCLLCLTITAPVLLQAVNEGLALRAATDGGEAIPFWDTATTRLLRRHKTAPRNDTGPAIHRLQDETAITKGDWGEAYRCFAGESFATENALVAPAGQRRVDRGGSWVDNRQPCRAASRERKPPDERTMTNGIRVVV